MTHVVGPALLMPRTWSTIAASVAERWHDLTDDSRFIAPLFAIAALFVAATITERLTVRMLRRAYWRRVARARAAEHIDELQRQKRQQTIVTLLESIVRYGIFGAALLASIAYVAPHGVGSVFGAGFLVVLVGFGFQRLLSDVVAGALLLFENHFAVGDVITVHQQAVTGIVEEFSLRTTSLRTLGGDRVTILNGTMLAFTRYSHGQREFRLEFLARGDEVEWRAQQVCELELGRMHQRCILGPHVALAERAPGSDLTRVELRVVVPPMHESIVDQLAAVLAASFGDDLVGGVHALNLHQPAFDAYRTALLVRE